MIAGALGAAAISLVFFTFGSALGLSAVSPYPYAALSLTTFLILAALFAPWSRSAASRPAVTSPDACARPG